MDDKHHLFIQFERDDMRIGLVHMPQLPDHPILTRVVGLFGLVASHALLP